MERIRKMFRSINIKIQYIIWSLERIEMLHLGDSVMYEDKRCVLLQGVNNPYWNLVHWDSNGNTEIFYSIHMNNFKRISSIRSVIENLRNDYRFQMHSWYLIDMNKTGRISYINSSNIKFN